MGELLILIASIIAVVGLWLEKKFKWKDWIFALMIIVAIIMLLSGFFIYYKGV